MEKQIAQILNVPESYVVVTNNDGEVIDVNINGAYYYAKLTKQGKIKKNSLKRNFS